MSHEPPDPFAGPGRDTFTAPDHYSAPAAWGEVHRPDDYSPEAIRADLWTDPRSGERLPGAPPIRQATHGDADERLSPPPPRPTPGQLERDVRAAVVHAAVRFCHEAPVTAVQALAYRLRPSPIACVYVAGPYSGADGLSIERNVRAAEDLAYEVARIGAMPMCPHTNLRFMSTDLNDFLYPATLEMMRRCDAVAFVPGWERSRGAVGERQEAVRIGLPCFDRILDLRVWLEGRRA